MIVQLTGVCKVWVWESQEVKTSLGSLLRFQKPLLNQDSISLFLIKSNKLITINNKITLFNEYNWEAIYHLYNPEMESKIWAEREQEWSQGWFPQGKEDTLCCSNEACATSTSRDHLSGRLQELQQQIKKALDLLRVGKAGKAQLCALRSGAEEPRSGQEPWDGTVAHTIGLLWHWPGGPGDFSFGLFIPPDLGVNLSHIVP